MRHWNPRIAYEIVLGAMLATGLTIITRQSRRLAEFERRQAADAQSLRLLQQALRQKGLQPGATEIIGQQLGPADEAGIARREAVIARLDQELAQSQSTTEDLRKQLAAANEENAKLQGSVEERLQKQQADSAAEAQELQKKLDAAVAQLDIAHERVAALDADYTRLKTETTSVTARAAEVARTVASLQDLERRREVYLTSILRRYRDITGEFRAMSSILDTSHEGVTNACSGAALSRIQNAVTSTEDDLRQLGELSARTQKLEKQLLKN